MIAALFKVRKAWRQRSLHYLGWYSLNRIQSVDPVPYGTMTFVTSYDSNFPYDGGRKQWAEQRALNRYIEWRDQ